MSYRDVLSIKPFRDLWLGQAISQLGDAFYFVTFMFMVDKVTGSAAMVGYVGALETLPFLLVGPYAGVLADRMDRRKLMLYSDWACFLILSALAVVMYHLGKPPTWMLLTIPFLLSIVRSFFLPAKSAAIPAIVPPEKLMAANSLSMATQNIMPMLGLALSAGVLAQLYGLSEKWFFVGSIGLNALSFLFSAFFVQQLDPIEPKRDAEQVHPWYDFTDGLRYVWRRVDLRVMLPLLAVFRLSVAPFFVAYVVANKQWFDGKPQTLSWLEFAFFLGMVTASPLVAKFTIHRPARWFCAGLGAVGVLVGLMGYSSNFWLFAFLNMLCGFAVPPADLPMNTYIQLSTPDAYRGRVNAALGIIASGAMPIGYALGGGLLDRVGLTGLFLVMGSGMVAACVTGALFREFREVVMPSPEGMKAATPS